MSSQHRYLQLDALRGFAALGVVLWHYTVYFVLKFGPYNGDLWFTIDRGFYGVNLFFTISGFVILVTLDRCKTVKEFLIKRFSRLYPLFFVSIILTWTTVSIFGLPNKEVSLLDAIFNFTMMPGLLGFRQVDMVYWTLEIELLFYLWCALILLFRWVDRLPMLMVIHSLVFLLLEFIERNYQITILHDKVVKILIGNTFYQFAFGILLYLWVSGKAKLSRCLFIFILSFVNGLYLKGNPVYGFYLLVIPMLVLFAVKGKMPFLEWPVFLFFGKISYALYLCHSHIGYVIIYRLREFDINPNIAILLTTMFVILLSWILHRAIEVPAQSFLHRRFFSAKS